MATHHNEEQDRLHKQLLTEIDDNFNFSDAASAAAFKMQITAPLGGRDVLERCETLLDVFRQLAKRNKLGISNYDVLKKAFAESNNEDIVKIIEEKERLIRAAVSTDPRVWIHTLPKRRQLLTDKDLARLCKTLGANWELAFYELGLTQQDVWRCKMNNPTSVLMQINEALAIWKKKNPGQAHLENFVTTLSRCDGVSVDWDEMMAVAKNL